MNIVCATDDNFVQHCVIMLVSLLIHNKDVTVFILTEGLSKENQKIIEDEVSANNGKVVFCKVDSNIVQKFPMPDIPGLTHISRATYYRLLIPLLLPASVDKAIYLDCDIVVNDSIKTLWDLDLTGYALAASLQIGAGYEAERLGYPIEFGYFNAGVNVINIEYWKKNDVMTQLLSFIHQNFSKIKYHDQDTLNAVLYDHTLHIDPKWNMTIFNTVGLMKKGDVVDGVLINDYAEEKKSVVTNINHPPILHFASRPKPWQDKCRHPLAKLYFHYAGKTIHYKDIMPPNKLEYNIAVLLYKIRANLSNIYQYFVHADPSRK